MLNFFKTLLVSYGLVAGTAILLLSWTVEKYQASYWDQKAAAISELRTHAFQELILAQSNAMFLTRKAEAEKLLPLFETNQDVINSFHAYKELMQVLCRRLPSVYQDGLNQLSETVNQVLDLYKTDFKEKGQRSLSEQEAKTVSDITNPVQALISIGEGAAATESFYQAGIERLETLRRVTHALEDRKDYDNQFSSVIEDMKSFAKSASEGKPPATSVTVLIDRLYSLTNNVIQDIHAYAKHVTQKKYQYASIYRLFYILGSLLILLSLVVKKGAG